jgi:hypothetical protein
MRHKIISAVILGIFLISLASALTTVQLSPSGIIQNVSQNHVTFFQINYNATSDINSTISVFPQGNFPTGFISSDTSVISVPTAGKQGSVNIKVNSSVSPDTYTGNIVFGSNLVPISITVNGQQQQQPNQDCKIYTLPIPLSKSIERDTTSTQQIDIYISKYCTSALTINTNQPRLAKPIKFDQMTGSVEPAQKFTITLSYDSRGVQKGTYTDSIIVTGVDSAENIYSLSLPISLTVTDVISPISNGSFSGLPSCSLSTASFSLNSSFSLTCNNVDPNIQIVPNVDSNFLVGVYPYVQQSTNSYSYTMKPTNLGTTTLKANFVYQNLVVGTYSNVISISSGGIYTSGVGLAFRFYPELSTSNGKNLLLRVIDNATQTILSDALIYLDGVISNTTINIDPNRFYELRGSHAGYPDLIVNLSLPQRPINFNLSEQYVAGQSLEFSADAPNFTVLFDNQIVSMPYSIPSAGQHTVTVMALGYTTTEKNITVLDAPIAVEPTTTDANAGKGSLILVVVNKNNTDLKVNYQKDSTSIVSLLTEVTGDRVSFTAQNDGIYSVYANGFVVKTYTIKSSSFFFSWYMIILYIVIGIVAITIFVRKINNSSGYSPSGGFSVPAGGG